MTVIADICYVLTLARHHTKHFTYITSLSPYTVLLNIQPCLSLHLILIQSKPESTTT